jgi:flagellar hook-basal body complex protein FliE
MGNSLTSVCRQPAEETKYAVETPAYESTIYPTDLAEPKEVYEQRNAVEATVDETKDAAAEIKDAVEAKVDEITDAAVETKDVVEAKVREAKENIEEVVEEMAKAENATNTPLVVVVEKDETAEQDVPKPCVTPLKMVFELKGARKTVDFTHNALGFEYSQGGKGCCSSIKPVTVTKVTPNGQAASLGMERGAVIRQVNEKDIADLKQMQCLVDKHKATLPPPEVSN